MNRPDPDANHLGVEMKNDKGEQIVITSNQIGALICITS